MAAATVLALFSCGGKSKIPPLRESYAWDDTLPFGTSVNYNLMRQAFPGHIINIKKDAPKKSLAYLTDSKSLYFCVTRNFYPSKEDRLALLNFVSRGNSVFISASAYDSSFLDDMGLEFVNLEKLNFFSRMLDTHVAPSENITPNPVQYAYFYLPMNNGFLLPPNAQNVLGLNETGKPNYVVYQWGSGYFFLHAEPRSFSNYFLLTRNNYQYLEKVLGTLPENPENFYYDSYFQKNINRGSSGAGSILAFLPFKIAFIMAVLLLLLFVFFSGKRRQRIVPVVKPFENASVKFAQAVAGLYLNEKDNRVIADKMITYFNEHVRNNYFMNMHGSNEQLADTLSRKSGISYEKTRALFETIQVVQQQGKVSDTVLLQLNNQMQEFYKLKK